MNYVVYSLFTGGITSSGTVNSIDNLSHMVIEGESAVLVDVPEWANHNSHRVVSGELVAYTEAQAALKRTRHPRGIVWQESSCSWVDERLLQDQKDAAWERIKAARESHIDAPLSTPYGTVDSKAKDRTNITDAVLLLQTLAAIGTPTDIDFTLADNTTVTLTTTEMVTVGLLLGQKVQAAHAQARTLRAQIDAANSSTELGAIVWV